MAARMSQDRILLPGPFLASYIPPGLSARPSPSSPSPPTPPLSHYLLFADKRVGEERGRTFGGRRRRKGIKESGEKITSGVGLPFSSNGMIWADSAPSLASAAVPPLPTIHPPRTFPVCQSLSRTSSPHVPRRLAPSPPDFLLLASNLPLKTSPPSPTFTYTQIAAHTCLRSSTVTCFRPSFTDCLLPPSSRPCFLLLFASTSLFLPHPTPPPSNDLLPAPAVSLSSRSPYSSYIVSPSAHIPPLAPGYVKGGRVTRTATG
ncbi:hypothetical protein R3P38DRAFT_3291802 [Favolaschia claudopus]|uniref:Uncharacterized protein n=1 Tax=Favolaschia claudopus TaxID=2862362 RepID=A0AAV9ZMU9_9AGAR